MEPTPLGVTLHPPDLLTGEAGRGRGEISVKWAVPLTSSLQT